MPFSINNFRFNGLQYGGVRPTLFDVELVFPEALGINSETYQRVMLLCRSATVPIMPLESIRVPYQGRSIKVAGDREFPDWTVRIINDEDFSIRVALEKWSDSINTLEGNRMLNTFPMGYKTSATVRQYSKGGPGEGAVPLRAYKLHGIFPVNVDAMVVDWDAQNQIQEFDVTFAYDYWTPADAVDDFEPAFPPVNGEQ